MSWLKTNLSTFLVFAVLLTIVIVIITRLILKRKKGENIQCGGACKCCSNKCCCEYSDQLLGMSENQTNSNLKDKTE